MKKLFFVAALLATCSEAWSQTLEQMLSGEEQAKLSTLTMTPAQREQLRETIILLFRQGYAKGQAQAPITDSVIESNIDGTFNGWTGETIFKLLNGQIWQQSSYSYSYTYSYSPKVLIFPSGGGHKMQVEGSSDTISVRRLK